jgi:hypothetical protein
LGNRKSYASDAIGRWPGFRGVYVGHPDLQRAVGTLSGKEAVQMSVGVTTIRMPGYSKPGRVWLPWLVAWLGASLIAVANGIARRAVYQERIGSTAAHYVSTALLVVLLGAYLWLLARCWPIPTRRAALEIGGAWTVLTIIFEFGLGRFVAGESWTALLEQYDLTRGNVWVLIPIWTAVGPAVMRRARGGKACNKRQVLA